MKSSHTLYKQYMIRIDDKQNTLFNTHSITQKYNIITYKKEHEMKKRVT